MHAKSFVNTTGDRNNGKLIADLGKYGIIASTYQSFKQLNRFVCLQRSMRNCSDCGIFEHSLISSFRSQCTHSLCLRGGTLVDCHIQYSWIHLFCQNDDQCIQTFLNIVFRKCDIYYTYSPRNFCEYLDRITRPKRPREIGFTAKRFFLITKSRRTGAFNLNLVSEQSIFIYSFSFCYSMYNFLL